MNAMAGLGGGLCFPIPAPWIFPLPFFPLTDQFSALPVAPVLLEQVPLPLSPAPIHPLRLLLPPWPHLLSPWRLQFFPSLVLLQPLLLHPGAAPLMVLCLLLFMEAASSSPLLLPMVGLPQHLVPLLLSPHPLPPRRLEALVLGLPHRLLLPALWANVHFLLLRHHLLRFCFPLSPPYLFLFPFIHLRSQIRGSLRPFFPWMKFIPLASLLSLRLLPRLLWVALHSRTLDCILCNGSSSSKISL